MPHYLSDDELKRTALWHRLRRRSASEPGRFMSRGRGPRGGCPPPEGVDVAYPPKICRANDTVKHVMEVSGFNSLLHLYDTEDKALAAFA